MFFWVKFGNVFTYYVIACSITRWRSHTLNRVYFYCKTKLRLGVSDRQGKYAFAQLSFYLQGRFSYINEREKASLDYKQKHAHVAENEPPPGKFGLLYSMCYIMEFQGFDRIDVLGLSQLGQFLETVWVPLKPAKLKKVF